MEARTDNESIMSRGPDVKFAFENTFQVTKGAFTKEDIVKARTVLDLGMGRGGVGAVLRAMNPSLKLFGSDKFSYDGKTHYGLYDQRIIGDATSDDTWKSISSFPNFDLIISLGLPQHVIEYLLLNADKYKMKLNDGEVCVLMSDLGNTPIFPEPFALYKGNVVMNNHIFIYNK